MVLDSITKAHVGIINTKLKTIWMRETLHTRGAFLLHAPLKEPDSYSLGLYAHAGRVPGSTLAVRRAGKMDFHPPAYISLPCCLLPLLSADCRLQLFYPSNTGPTTQFPISQISGTISGIHSACASAPSRVSLRLHGLHGHGDWTGKGGLRCLGYCTSLHLGTYG